MTYLQSFGKDSFVDAGLKDERVVCCVSLRYFRTKFPILSCPTVSLTCSCFIMAMMTIWQWFISSFFKDNNEITVDKFAFFDLITGLIFFIWDCGGGGGGIVGGFCFYLRLYWILPNVLSAKILSSNSAGSISDEFWISSSSFLIFRSLYRPGLGFRFSLQLVEYTGGSRWYPALKTSS